MKLRALLSAAETLLLGGWGERKWGEGHEADGGDGTAKHRTAAARENPARAHLATVLGVDGYEGSHVGRTKSIQSEILELSLK